MAESKPAHRVGPLDVALTSFGLVGRALGLRLPGLHRPGRHRRPGAPPGIEHHPELARPPEPGKVVIRCTDYGPERIESFEVEDLEAFLAEPRPAWSAVRWVNVDGLHAWVVGRLKQHFGFHTLAAEDVLHVPQRPKVEAYEDHLFFVARMLRLQQGHLVSEQVSFFLSPGQLLCFREVSGDVWQPIRERLGAKGSKLRQRDASYLAYTLLDAMVDHCFPILEHYGDLLEQVEEELLETPRPEHQQRVHAARRELLLLRRVTWPTRELVEALADGEDDRIAPDTRTYLRDVRDHAVQLIDIVESYRELASSLSELYLASVSNRMNEVMKVLTIIATLFIPLGFLAGVYGTNFEVLPELRWRYAYPAFWAVCLLVAAGLLAYFRHKGWLGRR